MVSDHLLYPKELQSRYPYSPYPDGRPIWEPEAAWPEPWVLIGAMSSVTTQLHFTTNIYVAGHRPLLQVAKEVATAAVLSDDRVALGVGAGWMKEEFDLQGQDYSKRGKKLTEAIQAWKELWKGGWVEWHGEHYDIPACTLEPHPTKPIPIYVGGHTDAALRRVVAFGDHWHGLNVEPDQARDHKQKLFTMLSAAGRPTDGFTFQVRLHIDIDAIDVNEWRDKAAAYAEAGVDELVLAPQSGDVAKNERWIDTLVPALTS